MIRNCRLILCLCIACFYSLVLNSFVVAGEQAVSLFPRSEKPASTVYVFDARKCDRETKTLVATIQGAVNQACPELYLILSTNNITPLDESADSDRKISMDIAWVNWLSKNQYIENVEQLSSVEDVISHFNMKKVVVIDPEFPATINLGCMIASLENAAVAYPASVEKYGLDVAIDLRGKWQTNAEAYRWALDNLWPKMDHSVMACMPPIINAHLRDYLVAKKIFTIWLPNPEYKGKGTSEDEMDVLKSILAELPVNIPVLGYPSCGGKDKGIGEGSGVRLLTEYGKFLIPTDWRSNQSVWSGLEAKNKEFKQLKPRKLKLEKDKIYATFLISDGDNMNMWFDFVPTTKYWRSEYRGKLPLAWSIGPGMIDMQAPLLDYYYSSLTPMDSMGCAVSGIGYMYPEFYGKAYGSRQGEILDGYIELTRKYMEKLDLSWCWTTIVDETDGKNIRKYVDRISDMEIMFEGYGRQWWKDEPYLVNDIPIFHFVNDAVDPAQTLKEAIDNAPTARPGFVAIFIQNWPFSVDKIEKMRQALGDDYIFVRPEELADLFNQYNK